MGTRIDFTWPDKVAEFNSVEEAQETLNELLTVMPHSAVITVGPGKNKPVRITIVSGSDTMELPESPDDMMVQGVVRIMRELNYTVQVQETLSVDPTLN